MSHFTDHNKVQRRKYAATKEKTEKCSPHIFEFFTLTYVSLDTLSLNCLATLQSDQIRIYIICFLCVDIVVY